MLQQNKENTSENLSFDYVYINEATKFKLFRPWFNFSLPSDIQVIKFHDLYITRQGEIEPWSK